LAGRVRLPWLLELRQERLHDLAFEGARERGVAQRARLGRGPEEGRAHETPERGGVGAERAQASLEAELADPVSEEAAGVPLERGALDAHAREPGRPRRAVVQFGALEQDRDVARGREPALDPGRSAAPERQQEGHRPPWSAPGLEHAERPRLDAELHPRRVY